MFRNNLSHILIQLPLADLNSQDLSSPFLCSSSPVPSDSPSNLAVTYMGNSSIFLSWSVGFDGYSNLSSVVISYEVDRYPQDGTRSQTFVMGTSATLTGLYPYSNYTIHVRLTNAVGLVSNPTNITSTTISLSEPLLLMLYWFNPSTTTGPAAPTITSLVADSSTQLTITWVVSI